MHHQKSITSAAPTAKPTANSTPGRAKNVIDFPSPPPTVRSQAHPSPAPSGADFGSSDPVGFLTFDEPLSFEFRPPASHRAPQGGQNDGASAVPPPGAPSEHSGETWDRRSRAVVFKTEPVTPTPGPLAIPDRDMAMALADAGYMPWSEYVELYGGGSTALPRLVNGVYIDGRSS